MKAVIPVVLLYISALLLSSCNHTAKDYYPSGAIKSEISTENGKYQGPAVYYYETGKPMITSTYKNNKLEGTLLRYYESGYRKELQTYKAGVQDGVARTWDRYAHLLQEMYYKDGKPDGPFQEWYPNRVLKAEGHFKDGMNEGIWLYYDDFGRVTGQGEFSRGNGTQKVYYANGQILQLTRYKKNVKDGEEVFYTEDGKVKQTILYRNGNVLSSSSTGK